MGKDIYVVFIKRRGKDCSVEGGHSIYTIPFMYELIDKGKRKIKEEKKRMEL